MLLNGRERLVLLNTVLPQEGTLLTMKLMHDLRDALQLGKEDLKTLNVESSTQQMSWEKLDDLPEKEVEIHTLLASEIVDALNVLDAKKKVTPQHVSLFKKFGATGKKG